MCSSRCGNPEVSFRIRRLIIIRINLRWRLPRSSAARRAALAGALMISPASTVRVALRFWGMIARFLTHAVLLSQGTLPYRRRGPVDPVPGLPLRLAAFFAFFALAAECLLVLR